MRVSFENILLAFEFANAGSAGENEAFLCKQTGETFVRSEFTEDWTNCRTISKTARNTFNCPVSGNSISASRLYWTSRGNCCPTMSMRFGGYSPEQAPTLRSRICYVGRA